MATALGWPSGVEACGESQKLKVQPWDVEMGARILTPGAPSLALNWAPGVRQDLDYPGAWGLSGKNDKFP